MNRTLRILGIRGVPAAHGGFETFAEYLSLHLVERGWRVIVYCQEDEGDGIWEDTWNGIERVHIPVSRPGPLGTILFDWKSITHAARHRDTCLTLGYNTAVFCARLRARGIRNVINMDGIEWSRAKWGAAAKSWFWLNDWAGSWLGNHLVADHPEIKRHLSTRTRAAKITTIAYGAEQVSHASEAPVLALGLQPGRYLTLIARAEPENSVLDVVRAFSRKPRGYTLLVLGHYAPEHPYQNSVLAAASDEVLFAGAIYDKTIVQALRFHCAAYVHGHQVGGTNPSLVEALGAGNAVIAHDNRFNRWVAGDGARYFSGEDAFADVLEAISASPELLVAMKQSSSQRFQNGLTWPCILEQYEQLLEQFL
ncbi:DUF1972 domain-containing protein [Stenotrophomonas sp. 24(2023)]|uniref:DUF1972 domain-containing protein n=1 Tax=Stenotrophomonas sp. 24(2023) TaxID=3068324 RepID=UPI0027DEECF6|nr:DUF1972 domain-containing protein [Stenotrophomonas sp. 24(2023)]WMJ70875.1 DUF1972 domain-containing protein [Stenotrophomonas sp. 24(2023)]